MKPDPFERFRDLFPRTARDESQDGEPLASRAWPILFSLGVAVVLWFTVSMRETYTVSVESPIRILTLPERQALREAPLSTARVQYQGVGWDLLSLIRRPPEIPIFADGEEVNLLSAASEASQLPVGVSVQGVQPQTIELSLETALTRRLPIRLVGDLDFEPGYGLLVPPRLQPDSVDVRGARSVLQGFDAWPTQNFTLDALHGPVTAAVPLSDTLQSVVGLEVERTQVTLDVAQFTEGTRMLPVRVQGVPPGVSSVRLIPSRVRATFLVPTDGNHYDDALESENFYAVVDYADIARDSTAGAVPVTPYIPDGLLVQEVRLEPRQLEYYTVRE